MMELYGMNALGDVYASYERYVQEAEMKGMKPVSMLKFALGRY